MSRRRRKRVKSIVKFTVLLFTPIISVSVFKSIPKFLNVLNKADSIMLKNENAGNLKQGKSEELSYNLHYNEDYEDVFNEDFDLSVGFGFEEETADEKNNKSPYETVSEKHRDIRINRGAVKYALLPVWILNTKWNDQKYMFAMNGQTGKMVGDLPVDKKKRWLYFGAAYGISAVITALITFLVL